MSCTPVDPNTWREPQIVPRSRWGAVEPKGHIPPLEIPVPYFFLTWAAAVPHCYSPMECLIVVQRLQKLHMDMGAPDVPYNFMIGDDGQVYEGRGWLQSVPVHPRFAEREGHALVFAYIGKKLWKNVPEDMEPWMADEIREFRGAYELLNYGLDNKYIDADKYLTGYRWEPEDWNTYGGRLEDADFTEPPEEERRRNRKRYEEDNDDG